jgi:hypothetical protein
MNHYGLCELGIVEVAKHLVIKIEVRRLPDYFAVGDMYYRELLTHVRHAYTNYDELTEEMPSCADYRAHGGYCPHDFDKGECWLRTEAYDILKWAATVEAERLLTGLVQDEV